MAKDLVFESERYEKHRRLRLILLPIVFLAAVLILAALAALLIGYFRGQSHTGGENLAYPYTWRAGRNGVVTLELDHATVPDDIWQYEETSGVLDVTGGKQTKTVTRFTLTPTATGRALSVFRLTENGSDVYELSVLTETQSVDGAMQTLFALSPRTCLASVSMFFFSNLLDVWLFQRLKKATGGRMLWLRNNIATCVSQVVENFFFFLIAFGGFMDISTIVELTACVSLVEVLVAFCDTPFLYLARRIGSRIRPLE